MSRHTYSLLLPLLLVLTPVHGHEHHTELTELTEEEVTVPIDSILWMWWGIPFPIGMVFGLSRSRWHIPLQVKLRLSASPFTRCSPAYRSGPESPFIWLLLSKLQVSCLRLVATSLGMHMAAEVSFRAHMASLPTSFSCRLLRRAHSACTSNCTSTSGRGGPWPCVLTGLSESHVQCSVGCRCSSARLCPADCVVAARCCSVSRIILWCVAYDKVPCEGYRLENRPLMRFRIFSSVIWYI